MCTYDERNNFDYFHKTKEVGHVQSEDSYITIFDRFGANSAQTFPSMLRLVGKY